MYAKWVLYLGFEEVGQEVSFLPLLDAVHMLLELLVRFPNEIHSALIEGIVIKGRYFVCVQFLDFFEPLGSIDEIG